jgi:hypothetical protein
VDSEKVYVRIAASFVLRDGSEFPGYVRGQSFYRAVGKEPNAIFPIHFRGTPGLATGIVTGELSGFYRVKLGAIPFKIEY